MEAGFARLNTRLPDMLADIKRRSPQARVVVVGFPNPFPADGSTCGSSVPLAKGDVTWLHQTTDRLNFAGLSSARATIVSVPSVTDCGPLCWRTEGSSPVLVPRFEAIVVTDAMEQAVGAGTNRRPCSSTFGHVAIRERASRSCGPWQGTARRRQGPAKVFRRLCEPFVRACG